MDSVADAAVVVRAQRWTEVLGGLVANVVIVMVVSALSVLLVKRTRSLDVDIFVNEEEEEDVDDKEED